MLIEERKNRIGSDKLNSLKSTVFLVALLIAMTIITLASFDEANGPHILTGALVIALVKMIKALIAAGCIWLLVRSKLAFIAILNIAIGVLTIEQMTGDITPAIMDLF